MNWSSLHNNVRYITKNYRLYYPEKMDNAIDIVNELIHLDKIKKNGGKTYDRRSK